VYRKLSARRGLWVWDLERVVIAPFRER